MKFLGCKLVCVAQYGGVRPDLGEHLHLLTAKAGTEVQFVLFNGDFTASRGKTRLASYNNFIAKGRDSKIRESDLTKMESLVRAGDTVNMQFTSGMRSRIRQNALLTFLSRHDWESKSSHVDTHVRRAVLSQQLC